MHIPVLLEETISLLAPQANQHFIDCTLGGGGHAKKILDQTSPDGHLLAIDADGQAIAHGKKTLESYSGRVVFVQENFLKIKQIYNEQFALYSINGILCDLGVSSFELKDSDRGFSWQIDAPLDMRFDTRQSLTAAEIVNTWPSEQLQQILQEYGQEPLAYEVTKQIINSRQKQPITKTKTLAEAILLAYRHKLKTKKEIPWIGGKHPATKTFQALRIAVNDELASIAALLPQAIDIVEPGGRVAIISFHSLEDSMVKKYFRQEARDCLCPPELPECRCGHRASIKLVTKKPIQPSEQEKKANPSSRSARLRVVEKLKQ